MKKSNTISFSFVDNCMILCINSSGFGLLKLAFRFIFLKACVAFVVVVRSFHKVVGVLPAPLFLSSLKKTFNLGLASPLSPNLFFFFSHILFYLFFFLFVFFLFFFILSS